jgi:hypothetical protein
VDLPVLPGRIEARGGRREREGRGGRGRRGGIRGKREEERGEEGEEGDRRADGRREGGEAYPLPEEPPCTGPEIWIPKSEFVSGVSEI